MDGSTIEFIFLLLVAIGMGLAMGSCATMPYYRVPRGIPNGGKWTGKRAHCPLCNAKLRTRDLLPVFNWLVTKGKCFSCKAPVNPMYFFIEFTTTVFAVLAFLRFGLEDQTMFLVFGMTTVCVILIAIDIEHHKVFDRVLVVMVMLGLVYRVLLDPNLFNLIYSFMLVTMGAMAYKDMWEKKHDKEYGDLSYIKCVIVASIWLPFSAFALFLVSYIVMAKLLDLIVIKGNRPYTIPFSLAMVIATYVDYSFLPPILQP